MEYLCSKKKQRAWPLTQAAQHSLVVNKIKERPKVINKGHSWTKADQHSSSGDLLRLQLGLPSGSDGKESACNAGDPGSMPGLGRFLGEGNGNPLQYSCLGNTMEEHGRITWDHKQLDMT